jgi:hypothetical protein
MVNQTVAAEDLVTGSSNRPRRSWPKSAAALRKLNVMQLSRALILKLRPLRSRHRLTHWEIWLAPWVKSGNMGDNISRVAATGER